MRWLMKLWRRWALPFDERMRLARLYGNKVAAGELTEDQAYAELRRLNVM